MNSNHQDEESTCTSEATPLHVNSYRSRILGGNRQSYTLSSRVASSNTVNSSLTATTYNSSSATFSSSANLKNDGTAAIKASDDIIDVSKISSEQDELVSKKLRLKSRIKSTVTISILVAGLLICGLTLVQYPMHLLKRTEKNETSAPSKPFEPGSKQILSNKNMFDELGRYMINDYDAQPPFSDFLPGVAGIYGKPLWSFYTNRGQSIASFGVESKDSPIMEFYSANNAYQNTATLGFRTFYKFHRGGRWGGRKKTLVIEPFDAARTRYDRDQSGDTPDKSDLPIRTMFIGANEMQIREVDQLHMIETNVTYFVMPEEDFGAFVKRTTITNICKTKLHISILDGMPRIQPVGGKINGLLKTMGRTLEGFMGVYEADGNTMPFYRLSTEPSDKAAVVLEEEGNFVLSYVENQEPRLLPIVYDTSKLFGQDTGLSWPYKLDDMTVEDIVEGAQYGAAKTSSAFSAVNEITIYPGESITISTFYGKANTITDVPVIARRVSQGGFVEYKLRRARELIQQITSGVETKTQSDLFDAHVKQMYLDNSLRGGIPMILGEVDDDAKLANVDEDPRLKVYHLFSRIHGDLERDYNDFVLSPTYFSQGPGNFRDIAQNRRNDVIINPRIGSHNAKTFLSLIQADGYNPLSVESVVFTITDINECQRLASMAVGPADGHRRQREFLAGILCDGPFRFGQLATLMDQQNVFLLISFQDFFNEVGAVSHMSPMAVSKDGYWADHWTYLMDLIQTYLQIYPDREEAFLYDERLPYFFNPRVCLPRHLKYVLSKTLDGQSYHVRQLKASHEDKERLAEMRKYRNNESGWYDLEANYQHDSSQDIFLSSPVEKLFLLATLKFATRDPMGMGIEYEGGKPGWNDAMNGLVGMIGSGMPETFELKVLLTYLQQVSLKYRKPIVIPEELARLIDQISIALNVLDQASNADLNYADPVVEVPWHLFNYWDTVASARELYRNTTTRFVGKTEEYSHHMISNITTRWLHHLDVGIERAMRFGYLKSNENGNDLPPTYFSYNVTKWVITGEDDEEGHHFVNATRMVLNRFPLFLEGPVRMMKTIDLAKCHNVYESIKSSELYDKKLRMYTLSASLKGQNLDMGRMMAFSAGWLENQSVWLHMSYKYYLEMLRHGMYEQFFDEMQVGMLPFIDTGRSPIECSSFIVSSAFDDPATRGRGFLARLSGSTAEFLSILTLMMIGHEGPFFVNKDSNLLEMRLAPVLPSWLFQQNTSASVSDHKYSVQFNLFSSIQVTYFTDEAKDLFGINPKRYKLTMRDGTIIKVDGPTIEHDVAVKVRSGVFIEQIHAFF